MMSGEPLAHRRAYTSGGYASVVLGLAGKAQPFRPSGGTAA